MSCSFPSPAQKRPYQDVYDAEQELMAINPGQDVRQAYERFRAALWSEVEVSNDPNAFVLSWNTVDKFGKAQLLDYQVTGNVEALTSLKNCIKSAVENIP